MNTEAQKRPRIHPFSTHFLRVYYVELESLELRRLLITTHSKSLSVNLVKEILALNGRKMDSNFKAFYFQSVEIFFKQNAGRNIDKTDKSNFALIEAGPNVHLTPLRSPLKTSLWSIWMASKLVQDDWSLSTPEFNGQFLEQWIWDCSLIKFTWYRHKTVEESAYVPVCKARTAAIKIRIIYIARHFINITFNPQNNLIRQVLTASFYKWRKRDAKKK